MIIRKLARWRIRENELSLYGTLGQNDAESCAPSTILLAVVQWYDKFSLKMTGNSEAKHSLSGKSNSSIQEQCMGNICGIQEQRKCFIFFNDLSVKFWHFKGKKSFRMFGKTFYFKMLPIVIAMLFKWSTKFWNIVKLLKKNKRWIWFIKFLWVVIAKLQFMKFSKIMIVLPTVKGTVNEKLRHPYVKKPFPTIFENVWET